MGFPSPLTVAHRWVAERLQPGEIAVDATAGGGTDTLFLAKLSGRKGLVYAFDVQVEALELTRRRLDGEAAPLANVSLIHGSHEQMEEEVPAALHGKAAAVMFNLGYLPGSDGTVITKPHSTLAALQSALKLLRSKGIITAVLYPGHPGGNEEAEAVEEWAAGLHPHEAEVLLYRFLNRAHTAPYLLGIIRK